MPEKFEAPIEEEKQDSKPIEVLQDKVSIMGVELPRNREIGERVPPAAKFKDFSEDKFSLDILQRSLSGR